MFVFCLERGSFLKTKEALKTEPFVLSFYFYFLFLKVILTSKNSL
ncbi:hypothetical protein HPCPY1124_1475 [Helicobacter pylori CPY1124]|nr:hypothetical protein HPCPY1124_1475 [Helicobacter pylori CPY1124]